jgi:PBP1b-binding outer membrane lipoprotein LpoB
MKKTLFIVFLGILFLVSCSNYNKTKKANSEEATEQVQAAADDTSEEVIEPIDNSGEAIQDSTDDADPE